MDWKGMLAALALGLSACTSPVTFFQCVDDSQCGAGVCEPNEYCSFPDEMCPSGRVYGDEAAPGIAGQCVPVAEGSSGAATTSDSTTSVSTGAEGTSSEASGTSSDEGTTQAATFTSTSVGGSTDDTGLASAGDSSSSGAVNDCSEVGEQQCAQCALDTVCVRAFDVCAADGACSDVFTCVLACNEGDACAEECCVDIPDESATLYNDVVLCIGDACMPSTLPFSCF